MSDASEPDLSRAERGVLDLIDETAIVALTTALVEAPSENPGGTEAAAVDVLEKACLSLGLAVETHEVAPARLHYQNAIQSTGTSPVTQSTAVPVVAPSGSTP